MLQFNYRLLSSPLRPSPSPNSSSNQLLSFVKLRTAPPMARTLTVSRPRTESVPLSLVHSPLLDPKALPLLSVVDLSTPLPMAPQSSSPTSLMRTDSSPRVLIFPLLPKYLSASRGLSSTCVPTLSPRTRTKF